MATKMLPEQVRRVQELRRSSAARPSCNKARYTRKVKHSGRREVNERPGHEM